MIRNTHCPYCGVELVKAENLDHSRSVEHLIPNTILSTPRSKRDGDFYACRRCNSAKSKIDYVLGVVARSQSPDADFAAQTLIDAVTSPRKSSRKFIETVRNARHEPDGVHMRIPIEGRDLVDYLIFLAKGQYFRRTGEIFDATKLVAELQFVNKQVLASFEAQYQARHSSNPFEDLGGNPHSESICGQECIIWSKENDYLFVFHRYVGVIVRIRPKSRRNYARARQLERKLLKAFSGPKRR